MAFTDLPMLKAMSRLQSLLVHAYSARGQKAFPSHIHSTLCYDCSKIQALHGTFVTGF